jgi:hypothetical protein
MFSANADEFGNCIDFTAIINGDVIAPVAACKVVAACLRLVERLWANPILTSILGTYV